MLAELQYVKTDPVSAWSLIPENQLDLIWERFSNRFRFRPSVSSFPGITEPVPSVTYSVAGAFASLEDAHPITDDLDDAALRVSSTMAGPSGRVIALDWQHECYYFEPSRHDGRWRIPALPYGEYSIFISEDMADGWFGHPWEETICVFGHRATSSLELSLPRLFNSPVRRDGQSTP